MGKESIEEKVLEITLCHGLRLIKDLPTQQGLLRKQIVEINNPNVDVVIRGRKERLLHRTLLSVLIVSYLEAVIAIKNWPQEPI